MPPPPDSPSEVHYAPHFPDQSPILMPLCKKRKVTSPIKRTKNSRPQQQSREDSDSTLKDVDYFDPGDSIPSFNSSESMLSDTVQMDQVTQASSPVRSEDNYSAFLDAVMAEECGLYQLTDRLFVVNGWNIMRGKATVCQLYCFLQV